MYHTVLKKILASVMLKDSLGVLKHKVYQIYSLCWSLRHISVYLYRKLLLKVHKIDRILNSQQSTVIDFLAGKLILSPISIWKQFAEEKVS